MNRNDNNPNLETVPTDQATPDESQVRRPYEPPRVTKKRSVRQVTLFSAGAIGGPAAAPPAAIGP